MLVYCVGILGCSSKKEAKKLYLMKNLTAHYNIYFNAKEALDESESSIYSSYEEDFSQRLPIFRLPDENSAANESENLIGVIDRSNKIALEKYQSNWLDDAFLLIAKSYYLKGDYYNALEYYSYVSLTFPKEKKNKVAAYIGEIKNDFALNLYSDADSIIEKADSLNLKYYSDDLAAAKAQRALNNNDIQLAINSLKKALKNTKDKTNRIRWTYILAQLQEQNNETDVAKSNYTKIARSNASFEMAFNAKLSEIRISENENGKQFDKIATLTKLLKEDKNIQFKEKIYFQIANTYLQQKDIINAMKYYTISAHTIPGTVKQKGLSYLKLAEINFEEIKNYSQAQLYYDSTLRYLPKNYAGYASIATKANNLQYLSDRLVIIENQKELLSLSSLSDEELNQKLDKKFEAIVNKNQKVSTDENSPVLQSINDFSNANKSAGSFYFYNTAAISQGLSQFKAKWGTRKLSDNWRASSASGLLANSKDANRLTPDDQSQVFNPQNQNIDSLKSNFIKTIPYNPVSKKSANQKISNALYEIAIFYKDVLNENLEAIEAFEAIVLNYPYQENAANIYYQLYRMSAKIDPKLSEEYKRHLLEKYPGSIYAKTLIDPNYGKEQEIAKEQVKAEYNKLYNLYTDKRYSNVLDEVAKLRSKMGSFEAMDAQFSYLEALALGNTQKAPVFLASLNEIVTKYPNDVTVTPLVKQQINFINANRNAFDRRPTALIRSDGQQEYFVKAPPIVEEPIIVVAPVVKPEEVKQDVIIKQPEPKKDVVVAKTEPIKTEEPVKEEVVVVKEPVKVEPKKELVVAKTEPVKLKEPVKVEPKPEVKEPEIIAVKEPEPIKPAAINFSKNERLQHLIVINLLDPKQNIAQPFSKLSQYFYSKFDPSTVKLVIRVVSGTDKFIIISGDFYTKDQVDLVATELKSNLPTLMDGLTKEYKTFVISSENLKLLVSKEAIDQYIKSL
jgi:tetratricopeptide (TPR) repeat protein